MKCIPISWLIHSITLEHMTSIMYTDNFQLNPSLYENGLKTIVPEYAHFDC